jgi:membrane protein DedA with SNARE-associated domain
LTEALITYLEGAAAHAAVYGFLLVFIFMTVESSFVPFPSEVVMIPAGFLAARGALTTGEPMVDATFAVLCGLAGSLAGAYINYFLSKWLGKPFLARYGKYFLLPPPKLQRAEELFLLYGAGATFVCRLLPAIRQLISIPAGISRMPLTSFSFWTGLGAGIWVSILTAIGYAIGSRTAHLSYADLVHQGKAAVQQHLIWLVPCLLAGFAGYVLISKKIMATKGASPAPVPAEGAPPEL